MIRVTKKLKKEAKND